MWYKHAIVSRCLAALLLAVGLSPALADAPYCSLRDPGHQIYEMFPAATGYRSVVREISTETQVAVDKQIPFQLLQGELGQHTLYVPVQGDYALGYIQIRSELTDWGLAEIVWGLSIDREVVDFRFQRCRGRACKSVFKNGLQEILQGLNQEALIALLDDQGQLKQTYSSSMTEDELALASVVTRSAIKVIAVVESGWSSTVAELAQGHAIH